MDFCKGCKWAKSKDIDQHISFSEYYDLANGKESAWCGKPGRKKIYLHDGKTTCESKEV